MTDFIGVKLELVRPGPSHNQLLSPLTSYMALCGEGSPITFHIDLEHQQMLSGLERLRYATRQGSGFAEVPDRMRESALLEVGTDVKRVFEDIRTLLAEISRARVSHPDQDGRGRAVHLRLVLGGSELALIPFEMAFAPQAFPGEGLEFCLQLAMPVVPTRETRSSRQLPVAWDRQVTPKVLFVWAEPGGLTVPFKEHVHALRAAIEPWVAWPKNEPPAAEAKEEPQPAAGPPSEPPADEPPTIETTEKDRLASVRGSLRLIPNASVDDIRNLCATEQFTHVHILAHGAVYGVAGEERFGVALCRVNDRTRTDVVSGARLAEALTPLSRDGGWRSSPLVVTLATCDSGDQRSVLVPGGSIAHELHVAGIPWVFASQFPLTVRGSVRLAEALYAMLLRGDDPREALYEVRRQLHMLAERDHDWAAVVAYASVPDNFDDQIYNFFERQTHRAIEVALARADDLAAQNRRTRGDQAGQAARDAERERRLDLAIKGLDRWRARLPVGKGEQDRTRRAECYGIHGSVFKRMALLRMARDNKDPRVESLLKDALGYYRKAMDELASVGERHHWVATQALSISAVLKVPSDVSTVSTFKLARELAERDLQRSSTEGQAWAHGTLAELDLLSLYHMPNAGHAGAPPSPVAQDDVRKRVVQHCREIVRLAGLSSFQVSSTRRQFQRYVDAWSRPEWADIARAAVDALNRPA